MTLLSKQLYDTLMSKYIGKEITTTLKESIIGDLNQMMEEHIDKSRKYVEEIEDNPDYVDIFTVEEWKEAVDGGWIRNDDGSGYWMKDGKSSRDEVFGTPQLDATHVAWYNK